MRKFLFLIAFLIATGLTGQTTKEARATCTHLGGVVNCPVGITNGSNSITINADNTITWTGGQVSTGGCCPADAGTSTGAGLQNLNNTLGGAGRSGPGFGGFIELDNGLRVFINPEHDPARDGDPDEGTTEGTGGEDTARETGNTSLLVAGDGLGGVTLLGIGVGSCSDGRCSDGFAGTVYGAAPGDGYPSDGAANFGVGAWNSVPDFGACGSSGCGGTTSLPLLDPAKLPGIARYGSNQTTGNFDPFGSAGGFFNDPATGKSEVISDNPAEWSDRIKHAAALNTAYANFEIEYPFNDPNWASRSVDDFKKNPPTGLGFSTGAAYVPEFGLTESGRAFGASVVSTLQPGAGTVTPFTGSVELPRTNQFGGRPATIETLSGAQPGFRVTDPNTGKFADFATAQEAQIASSGITNGVEFDVAVEAGRTGGRALTPGDTPTTTGSATANSGGVRTPTVPRPVRPAGESVTFLEQAPVNGQIFRIEIVRTPDGRTLAVGTGEAAGHVFGEAKQSRSGFWRNEGRWTPPPAPPPIAANNRPAIIVSPATTPAAPQNAPAGSQTTLSVPLVENGIGGRTGAERGRTGAKASGQFNVVKERDAASAQILGATTGTAPAPVAANNRPAIIVAPGNSAGGSAPDVAPPPPPVGQGDDFVDTLTRNVPNEFRRSGVIVPAGTDLAEVRQAGAKEAGRVQPDIAEAIAENVPAQFRKSAAGPATDSRRIQDTIRRSDGNDMLRSVERVSASPNAFIATGN